VGLSTKQLTWLRIPLRRYSSVRAVAVRLGVVLGRVLGVFQRVELVPVRNMRVVTGGHVVAGLMVLRRFAMMMGGVLEMLGGFVMVVMGRMLFAHWVTPS
jgi:hypothetical protein